MERITNAKPNPDFLIRLVGRDMKPWRVPLRVLNRILGAVQRLVDQRDDLVDIDECDEPVEQLVQESRTLQLIGIKSLSAGYAVKSENRKVTLSVLTETGRGIDAPDKASWRPSSISSVEELSQTARQLGCVIEFREIEKGKPLGPIIAMIRPETASEVTRRAFRTGRTSVVGRLERVGGATAMRCGIHVQGRPKMLFCDVASTDLVRELGKLLYTDVVLTGEAVWYRSTGQLKSLNVSYFNPAKTESFAEVAKLIRAAAGGNAWDAIADPAAYIREMRG
jgi:hypothetical protein